MALKRIIDNYSKEELLKRLEKSNSFQSFIEGLGYSTGRSQNVRRVVIKKLEEMNINYKNYLHNNANGKNFKNKITDENYYVKGTYRGTSLSIRVKKDNKFKYECVICKNKGIWNGLPLVLHLDHIDGDSTNNYLNNLRWLCPNCHTQTDTYVNKKRV